MGCSCIILQLVSFDRNIYMNTSRRYLRNHQWQHTVVMPTYKTSWCMENTKKMFDKTGKPGTQKCGKSCAICKHMHETNSIKVKEAKNMVFLDRIDCKTRNVIYGIMCEQCNKVVYVGETGTMLYQRFANHISSIRRGIDEPIANHFNGKGHKLNNLKILGIEILK